MRFEADRIKTLAPGPPRKGRYVLYWMQQSQRAEENHALEYAIDQANRLGTVPVVVFGLTDDYPGANLRHYRFMLEGLQEVRQTLERRGIQFVLERMHPVTAALTYGRGAALIVCDRGYLSHQREWRREVAGKSDCPVVQVESDVLVPVETASGKVEYAARTIRPKIRRHLAERIVPFASVPVRRPSFKNGRGVLGGKGIAGTPAEVCRMLRVDASVTPVTEHFEGGTAVAKRRFDRFLLHRVAQYVQNRNQPQTDDVSSMSPYLHFGQISPLYLAERIGSLPPELLPAKEAFIEELVVRRELAVNFVYYTEDYDKYRSMPAWARKTLAAHAGDGRPHRYSREALTSADTHDPYWNAAMKEMKYTGYMHNYMRMYWGKKILEWSATPQHAYRTALALNNRYFLDGRDPNSYAGVGWVFGLHDRAWPGREIFGTVRYMAASGLERKCNIRGYVEKIETRISRTAIP